VATQTDASAFGTQSGNWAREPTVLLTRVRRRRLQPRAHRAPVLVEQAALIGYGDHLSQALTRAEMVVECVVGRADAGRRVKGADGVALFDAPVILLHPLMHRPACPMAHLRPPLCADGARIGVVPVRRHLFGGMTNDRARSGEEALGAVPIPRLAQQGIDQVPVGVNGPVEVAPASVHLHIRLITMPLAPCFAAPLRPQSLVQQGSEAILPLLHRLVGERTAAREDHLGHVAQAQFVAQTPEDHEQGAVGRHL